MPSTRPNVLLVFTDQQTLGAMSAYGNTHLSTPHMDAIAAGGVRFLNSYCASPVCGPARAALFTGRMPHQVGVDINDVPFLENHRTLGHLFREAGYETAYAGKWHLPGMYCWHPADAHGFRFLSFPEPKGQGGLGRVSDVPTTDQAVEFLRGQHDKPFLLAVSLHNPHDICGDIWRVAQQVERPAVLPPLPENFPRDPDEPQFISDCRQRRHYGNEANATRAWGISDYQLYLHTYYRLVEQVDVQIGRILTALRECGLERDTLVIFTSDHGEGVAAHQWVVKLMLYEEPVTVPLLLRWPGVIPAGAVDAKHLVSAVDLLPTMCAYAGISVASEKLAGVSLRPVIEQPELAGRDSLVAELQPDTKDASKLGRMIRTKRYKYVAFSYGRNPEMLFDLSLDPGERKNLAQNPASGPVLTEHRDLLRQWITATGDHFPLACVGPSVEALGQSRQLA